jgi:hypothetical protein
MMIADQLEKIDWKNLDLRSCILLTLIIAPAACVAFIFPLIPDYFEAISLKASSLLDVIELGRGRPWVFFAGIPYPATLRLFGDVSGMASVLILLTILTTPKLFTISEKWKALIRYLKHSHSDLYKKNWYVGLCGCLLLICIFPYQAINHFILPSIINISNHPLSFAWHVYLASLSPFGAILSIYLLIMVLYSRFFVN